MRLKLQTDLDGACRIKARRDQSDDKAPDSAIESQAEVVKEKFTVKARGYFVYLLETLLKDVRLNADIVRGMASFDPIVLLALPIEQSVSMFTVLYNSFSVRGWLPNSSLAEARDEYLSFLDQFLVSYSEFKNTLEVFLDMVDFLAPLPELRSRKHLFHLFQLSCLCLTEEGMELPPVKFQGVNSADPKSRLIDVILPAQSYLAQVPNSVTECISETSLMKYRELEDKCSRGIVAGDPWVHVDYFGRSHFQKILSTLFKSLKDIPEPTYPRTGSTSSGDEKRSGRSPTERSKVLFGRVTTSNDVVPEKEPRAGSSKS